MLTRSININSAKNPLPAFTLDMLANKVYVVTSPELISAVRRSHRTMSFDPLVTRTVKCVGGIKGAGLELLREKVARGGGLGPETVVSLRPMLLGEGLDQLNDTMIGCLRRSIEGLKTGVVDKAKDLDLYAWCAFVMTFATTEAVYGPLNPYSERSVREAYR